MDLRILGRFELVSDTGEPTPIRRPLVRGMIFAMILYRNEPLSQKRLIDLLWGLDADTDRLNSLRSCMWSARKVLPPGRLVTDDLGYRLRFDPRRDHVDVDRFRRLCRQGRAALSREHVTAERLLDEALRLWGTAQPADLLPATPAMTSLVTGLAEENRDARDALLQARLGLGRHRELLPELRALITAEPENERLWGHLMLALYRCGLKADALQVFAEACTALSVRAGVQPGAELHTLRHRIQADDPALKPDSTPAPSALPDGDPNRAHDVERDVLPRQLPSGLLDFTGRTDEAAELIGLLSPPEGRTAVPVVSVTGPPGVGKTALAVHVGHAVSHDYPDGQLYVRLAGALPKPPTAGVVLGEILRTLGVVAAEIPETTQQRAVVYRSRLAGRRVLVVLDDAVSPEQVRPLVPGTAGCAVIVTSRVRLAGLAASGLVNLAALEHTDALRLLARIIGRTRLDAEPDAAADVVRACGGLPLAIRIAAERLAARPTWPIAYLAHVLADEKHRLDELVAGDLAMRASIASSYQALSPQAQRLFRLLALAGAHEVGGWVADVLAGDAAAGLIGDLVDHSLLAASGMDALGQPRYRFHDLLRDYAIELLAADPDADSALERLLDAWVELADVADAVVPRALYVPVTARPPVRASVAIEPVKQRVAADPHGWFAAERGNLLAAVEAACAAGRYRQAREVALRISAYLHLHSYHEDAEQIWTTVGDAAEQADDMVFAARAWFRAASVAAADRGHHARAALLINRCITVFEEAGDRLRLARAYGVLGYCGRARGRLLQARSDGERGVELAREVADVHAEFFCLRMLAVTLCRLGHHNDGITSAEQALDIARYLGSDTYRCAGLYTLALAMAGRPREVIEVCAEGLALSATTGQELIRAHFRQQMGLACQQLQRHQDAIEALSAAADDFTSRADRYQAACCLRSLADSYQAAGQHDEAIGCLEESVTNFRELGISDQEVGTRKSLAKYPTPQSIPPGDN